MTNREFINKMDDALLTEFLLALIAGDIGYSLGDCDSCNHNKHACDLCMGEWLKQDSRDEDGLDAWVESLTCKAGNK